MAERQRGGWAQLGSPQASLWSNRHYLIVFAYLGLLDWSTQVVK